MQPLIGIVILNWNGGKDTLECLQSVAKLSYPHIQVILVDNGSSDGICEHIQEHEPHIHVLRNAHNLGFAEGNNMGIRHALAMRASYIFLLNNDTIIDKDAITHCLAVLDQNPHVGVVGPKILNYHRPHIIESAGGKISFKLARSFAIGYGEEDLGQYDHNATVNFVSGCAFMARASVFAEVGLFDKTYFAYYEDMTICHKIKQHGYDLMYASKAKVWHKVSAATGGYKNPNALFWSTRNRFLFIHHCGSPLDKLCFMLYFFLFYLPGYCTLNLYHKRFQHVKAMLQGLLSLLWHYLHYSRDFPYVIAIDGSPVHKSKGGVGHYTRGLIQGLLRYPSAYTVSVLETTVIRHRFSAWLGVLQHIFAEQIALPCKLLWMRADLVHYPAFVSPLWKTTKTIITIHDMAYHLFPHMFLKRYRLYLTLFVPFSAKRANLIIAVSQSTKNDIVRLLNIPEHKIRVVYQAINPIYHVMPNRKDLPTRLKTLNISGPYILSVGTLEPRKNIRTLIEAYAQLIQHTEHASLQLVIVGGKGWLYNDIFESARELHQQGKIVFTNYVSEDDMLCLYNGAELFVYPSFYEGFGLPPLEAMACGVPVITSNTSSLPEAVGDAAVMFSPHDTQALLTTMHEVLSNDSKKQDMIARGLKWTKRFHWDNVAKEMMAIYNEVLNRVER